MTEHTITSPRPSLFARKGEAEPAPAVAYVSLRQMQGKTDRRQEEPDRRAHWEDGQSDSRRRFTPRSGLAMGQQYVPWQAKAEAPRDAAGMGKTNPSVSNLSSLIRRREDGGAQPASRSPAPVPVPVPVPVPQRVAAQPPAPYKRKILRRQVTLRLEIDQFLKIKTLADSGGKTRQSVMAAAVAAYLEELESTESHAPEMQVSMRDMARAKDVIMTIRRRPRGQAKEMFVPTEFDRMMP